MEMRNKYFLISLYLLLVLFAISNGKRVRKRAIHNKHSAKRLKGGLKNAVRQGDKKPTDTCWTKLGAPKHFETMDALENRYADARRRFQKAINVADFDKEMLKIMIQSQGASDKVYHKAGDIPNQIPHGLNLGGYCMMRMKNSIVFFHRLKLRNDTFFTVTHLHNNFEKMYIKARLSLNDLHLYGSYERAITDKDPSIMFYRPTFSNIMFLLRNVKYSMEGRYRMIQDKLMIENIISTIEVPEVLMNYAVNGSTTGNPEKLPRKNIDDFINKIRIDIDKWLKHYFNDYLLYFELESAADNDQLREYDVKKSYELNKFVDTSLSAMKNRLYDIKAVNVKIPDFQIFAINGMQIKLKDGVVRGLDSMHRRSVATGRRGEDNTRKVDVVIGFSNLKVEYKYEAILTPGSPPMHGMFILTADDLTASLDIALVKEPEFVELKFDFLEQPRPESLVVEGPINRRIANIRHLLENHIISLMSNMLYHIITMLKTLTHCVPMLPSHLDPGDEYTPDGSENLKEKKQESEYAASREDSIEIVVPDKPGMPLKRMKIKYGEKFALVDLGDVMDGVTAPPAVEDRNNPSIVEEIISEDGEVQNRIDGDPGQGTFPYGLTRVDSAEVQIDQDGVPKTLHIKYNETYHVEDKHNSIGQRGDNFTEQVSGLNVSNNSKSKKFVLSKILRDKRKDTVIGNTVRNKKQKRQTQTAKLKLRPKRKRAFDRKDYDYIQTAHAATLEKSMPKAAKDFTRNINRKTTQQQNYANAKKILRRNSQISKNIIRTIPPTQSLVAKAPETLNKNFSETVGTKLAQHILKVKWAQKNKHRIETAVTNSSKTNKIGRQQPNSSLEPDNVNAPIFKSLSQIRANTTQIRNKRSKKKSSMRLQPMHFKDSNQNKNLKEVNTVGNKVRGITSKIQSNNISSRNRATQVIPTTSPFYKAKSSAYITNNTRTGKNTTNLRYNSTNKKLVRSFVKINKKEPKSLRSIATISKQIKEIGNKKLQIVTTTKKNQLRRESEQRNYAMDRHNSAEIQIPTETGALPKSVHIDYKQNFVLKEKRRDPEQKLEAPDDDTNDAINDDPSHVKNRNHDSPIVGPKNYAMERQDSAEVQLPAEAGAAPNTVHIDYKQNFEVKEKNFGAKLQIPGEDNNDNVDDAPADVKNRNQGLPIRGPKNYAMERHDSAEVQLPAEAGAASKTVHIDYKQNFEVKERVSGAKLQNPDEENNDDTNNNFNDAPADVENSNQDLPMNSPKNYAMERHDSAEVQLPVEDGGVPKTVHIDYKQNFEVKEKNSGAKLQNPEDDNNKDTNDNVNDAPTDVENRNQDLPINGPKNYAMERHDSAEVQLPAEDGGAPKTVHIDYKQNFEVEERNAGDKLQSPNDDGNDLMNDAPANVENRNQELPISGPKNYAMERQESAEVQLLAEAGAAPKTVHIDYKQNFKVNEKNSGAKLLNPDDDTNDNVDDANADAKNRNLDLPINGPKNYAMERHDSAEVQLPAEAGAAPNTVHIDYKQNFKVKEQNSGAKLQNPDDDNNDDTNDNVNDAPTDVKNRNQDLPISGVKNYAMKRHDSAELQLPAEAGAASKTVHIDYKQNFEVKEKDSVAKLQNPDDENNDDTNDRFNDAPTDVENRNQDLPMNGPKNYAMERHDSVEVQLPAEAGAAPKTVHIDYKQNFEVKEKNFGAKLQNPDDDNNDYTNDNVDDAHADVKNRNQELPINGPKNYAMEKHDSAEVQLPAEAGAAPKTVHIDYKQNFEVKEKNSRPKLQNPDDENNDDTNDGFNDAPADVENRNQDLPMNGPKNYAMDRHDSAEVQLPAEAGAAPKTVHIDYKQNFEVKEQDADDKLQSPDDDVNYAMNDGTANVENRNKDLPISGPKNYALERHDSAEVQLPAEPGGAPKTIHLNYKQDFEVKERGGIKINSLTSQKEINKKSSPTIQRRHQDISSTGPKNYAMEKLDSAEVQLTAANTIPKTVHIGYKQNFEVKEKDTGSKLQSPDDARNNAMNNVPANVENRNQNLPITGPKNYAMERHDSAEVQLPAEASAAAKSVHIDYKENFEVKEKDASAKLQTPEDENNDNVKDTPANVENRNQGLPISGPKNYAMERHDSAEVQLPSEVGAAPKTVHINYKENFEVKEKNDGYKLQSPDDGNNDAINDAPTNVENRNQDLPLSGPKNYAMERHDSAEVQLPAEAGSAPKTVHIDYKQNFEVKEKNSEAKLLTPDDDNNVDNNNNAPAYIENRNQDLPTNGPNNYAMERYDSAEVQLPAAAGTAPKTVHIDYKQNFEVIEKDSEAKLLTPNDDINNDNDSVNDAPADVQNRNIDLPTSGPKNYALERHDSAEVQLPAEIGAAPKTVHIDYKQNFEVKEKDAGDKLQSPDDGNNDQNNNAMNDATTNVENRNQDLPINGPKNYAMERHDSAEVQLPAEAGTAPKTVHIDYKQNFDVKEKDSESKLQNPDDNNDNDTNDNVNNAPADVKNRNQDLPTNGPKNYAMERHDSAEVQLPAEAGGAPKTVHIDYKQNFEVKEQDAEDKLQSPDDDINVENRNQDLPSSGPKNYAMERHDSAEVQLPAEAGAAPKTVHIDYKQTFEVKEKDSEFKLQSPGDETNDAVKNDDPLQNNQQSNQSEASSVSDVENRNLDYSSSGPLNYAMERQDSAEVVLPGESGVLPKTVHINYKEQFDIKDKSVSADKVEFSSVESSHNFPGKLDDANNKLTDGNNSEGDSAAVVEDRELEKPSSGPLNYAMNRQDSAEVEIPGESGTPSKIVHLNYKENFVLKDKGISGSQSINHDVAGDTVSSGDEQTVENRISNGPFGGPLNYAMNRQDSAEVKLPSESGAPPKTVHINYKENFVVNDKGSTNYQPVNNDVNGDTVSSSDEQVEDRASKTPPGASLNYAVNRQDSAEVKIPNDDGAPAKTVHLNYNENFVLNDKSNASSDSIKELRDKDESRRSFKATSSTLNHTNITSTKPS